jgi:hypothetical protein
MLASAILGVAHVRSTTMGVLHSEATATHLRRNLGALLAWLYAWEGDRVMALNRVFHPVSSAVHEELLL